MARNKQLFPADNSPHTKVTVEKVFLIRKTNLELKITLKGFFPFVQVFNCGQAGQLLAQSIARLQEKLLLEELREYKGQNPFAFILTIYANQGWIIKVLSYRKLQAMGNKEK